MSDQLLYHVRKAYAINTLLSRIKNMFLSLKIWITTIPSARLPILNDTVEHRMRATTGWGLDGQKLSVWLSIEWGGGEGQAGEVHLGGRPAKNKCWIIQILRAIGIVIRMPLIWLRQTERNGEGASIINLRFDISIRERKSANRPVTRQDYNLGWPQLNLRPSSYGSQSFGGGGFIRCERGTNNLIFTSTSHLHQSKVCSLYYYIISTWNTPITTT